MDVFSDSSLLDKEALLPNINDYLEEAKSKKFGQLHKTIFPIRTYVAFRKFAFYLDPRVEKKNWVPRFPLFLTYASVTIINSQEEVLLSSLEEFTKTRFRWGRWEMQLRD